MNIDTYIMYTYYDTRAHSAQCSTPDSAASKPATESCTIDDRKSGQPNKLEMGN